MTLRGTLNKNWVEVLEKVVNDMNNTPIKKLGFLKPNQVNSEIDSVFVKNAKKSHNIESIDETNWKTQLQNEENYISASSNIQKGDYVYRDSEQKIFDKSFDVSVNSFITNSWFSFLLISKQSFEQGLLLTLAASVIRVFAFFLLIIRKSHNERIRFH